jgi:hypothetical protein
MKDFRLVVRLHDGTQFHESNYMLVEEPDRKMIEKCVANSMDMNLRMKITKTEIYIGCVWTGPESST